jgi:hypothetical protein
MQNIYWVFQIIFFDAAHHSSRKKFKEEGSALFRSGAIIKHYTARGSNAPAFQGRNIGFQRHLYQQVTRAKRPSTTSVTTSHRTDDRTTSF